MMEIRREANDRWSCLCSAAFIRDIQSCHLFCQWNLETAHHVHTDYHNAVHADFEMIYTSEGICHESMRPEGDVGKLSEMVTLEDIDSLSPRVLSSSF